MSKSLANFSPVKPAVGLDRYKKLSYKGQSLKKNQIADAKLSSSKETPRISMINMSFQGKDAISTSKILSRNSTTFKSGGYAKRYQMQCVKRLTACRKFMYNFMRPNFLKFSAHPMIQQRSRIPSFKISQGCSSILKDTTALCNKTVVDIKNLPSNRSHSRNPFKTFCQSKTTEAVSSRDRDIIESRPTRRKVKVSLQQLLILNKVRIIDSSQKWLV